jgi:hypothetical protein
VRRLSSGVSGFYIFLSTFSVDDDDNDDEPPDHKQNKNRWPANLTSFASSFVIRRHHIIQVTEIVVRESQEITRVHQHLLPVLQVLETALDLVSALAAPSRRYDDDYDDWPANTWETLRLVPFYSFIHISFYSNSKY